MTGVSLDIAKKGLDFKTADEAGHITEWKLSNILRDKELYNNRIFHKAGKELKAEDLGLKYIDEK